MWRKRSEEEEERQEDEEEEAREEEVKRGVGGNEPSSLSLSFGDGYSSASFRCWSDPVTSSEALRATASRSRVPEKEGERVSQEER